MSAQVSLASAQPATSSVSESVTILTALIIREACVAASAAQVVVLGRAAHRSTKDPMAVPRDRFVRQDDRHRPGPDRERREGVF